MRIYGWLLLLGLGLIGGVPSHALTLSNFAETPCPFLTWEPEVEGETIICGTFDVPESRTGLSDGVVTLAVAIVKSTAETPGTPIIYLDGGPGGSALTGVHWWLSSALRAYSDIILLDQRGTGYSLPSLNCPEFDDGAPLTDDDPEQACYDRLVRDGVALGAYNSAENASDVAALIDALNLPQVTLFGISYGTRLALTTLRDHPEKLRSVIIDSVYPPNINGYEEQASNGVRAFELIFRDCEASEACRTAYPDLRNTFLTMIDDLDYDPMVGTDEYGDVLKLSGSDVVNEVFDLMYVTDVIPYLPAIITAAADRNYELYSTLGQYGGDDITTRLEAMTDAQFDNYIAQYLSFDTVDDYLDFQQTLSKTDYLALLEEVYNQGDDISAAQQAALDARLQEITGSRSVSDLYDFLKSLSDDEYYALVDRAYGTIDDDSEGVFDSVTCFEEIPFNSTRIAERLVDEVPRSLARALLYDVEARFVTCRIWEMTVAGDIENQPVTSTVPVLVLSGEYDPITPPAWGQIAADSLPNSYFYEFPAMGHGVIDVLSKPCPTSIALQFLKDPTQTPDASCITRMKPPVFVTNS